MIKKIILLVALISIVSCSTPYQTYSGRGGYSENKLSDNKFKISFSGNLYTPMYKAKDFALLRSAEIADQNNFKFFKIESDSKLYVLTSTTFKITCYNEKPEGNKVYEAKKVIEQIRKKHRLKS
jgi:hypothetical protein